MPCLLPHFLKNRPAHASHLVETYQQYCKNFYYTVSYSLFVLICSGFSRPAILVEKPDQQGLGVQSCQSAIVGEKGNLEKAICL